MRRKGREELAYYKQEKGIVDRLVGKQVLVKKKGNDREKDEESKESKNEVYTPSLEKREKQEGT